MSLLLQHIYRFCLSLILSASILFPNIYEGIHVFSEHEHEVCIDASSTHLHNKDVSCDLLKHKPSNQFVFEFDSHDFKIIQTPALKTPLLVNLVSSSHYLKESPRGPPAYS